MRFKQYIEEEIQNRKKVDPVGEDVSLNERFNEGNYFVSFIDENTGEVVHICGYMNCPNVISINHLFEELKTDKEFGKSSDYVDSLKVRIFHYKKDK